MAPIPVSIKHAILFTINSYEQSDLVDMTREFMDTMTPEQLATLSSIVHRRAVPLSPIVIGIGDQAIQIDHIALRSLQVLSDPATVLRHLQSHGIPTDQRPVDVYWDDEDLEQFKIDCEAILC